ncbi:hypothetical protein BGZ76_000543 [Entomortierella beljakovae]|nr:hypothetical protein BGZ76_000543 [Entomortierella beljakovae]
MPRQDYSLPTIVPLPKFVLPKKPSGSKPQVPEDKDVVMVDRENQSGESEDDYDIIDDDDLDSKFNDMDISEPSQPEKVAESSTEKGLPKESASSPFVDAMLKEKEMKDNMTTTENGALTHSTTGDARLDFFFEVVRGLDNSTILQLARESWKANPLDTLKLIFQVRSILHGKGERKAFYTCMEFLRKEHPRTLLYNLRFVPDHGYWKDLLNWLVFEVRDDHEAFDLNSESPLPKSEKSAKKPVPQARRSARGPRAARPAVKGPKPMAPKKSDEEKNVALSEASLKAIEAADEKNRQQSKAARDARIARDCKRLDNAKEAFRSNSFYRSLHLEVARLFANALVRDKARMEEGKSISLAAKWCPSLNQFHDNYTLIASTIAQILYPEPRPEEDHGVYVNRVRQLFRQEYYVPLRKSIPVLETFMSAQLWDEIQYNRVPSVAMKNNKGHFENYDKERFKEYLASVAKGETTIASQALMPHELVAEANKFLLLETSPDDLKVQTLEAQWKSYVDKLAKLGTMDSTMAICDVSGSMNGIPMEVSIALSLLLAQLSRPPYNKLVLTFSENPKIHKICEGSLLEQAASLRYMDWGGTTNLTRSFDLILDIAVKNKLPKEEMVKTLFIFSDMEFNQAIWYNGNTTNFEYAKQKFEGAGYDLPQIVFWNLRGSTRGNKPVKANEKGVAMVSGYSGMLMKLFLDGGDITAIEDPVQLMEKAIGGKEFSRLKVID